MKRLIIGLVLCMACVLTLHAAGQQEAEKPVTLELMYWDNEQTKVLKEALEEFHAINPNITVTMNVAPSKQYWQKLQTTTVAGTAPDVFWINYPNFPKYFNSNTLLNLSPYIEKSTITNISNYPASLMKKYTQNGAVYAIPEQFDTIILAYNKDLFDEAGIAYPDDTWTWDTLRDVAIKLTKNTPNGKQYGFLSSTDNHACYYDFMVTNGGFIVSDDDKKSGFDDPASIEAVQYLYDLMYKYHCSPTGKEIAELNHTLDMFYSKRVAMATVGAYHVPTIYASLGKSADFAAFPISPRTGYRRTLIHGTAWAGYAKTKNPKETWKLIEFLTDKEFNQKLARDAITTPSYKGMATDWVKSIPEYHLQKFIDAVDYSLPYPQSKKSEEWQSLERKIIKDVWIQSIGVDEAMHSIADQTNAILNK